MKPWVMMSGRRSRGRTWSVGLVLAATGLGATGGCLKEKESLVVVALTAETDLTAASQVTITIGSASKPFPLPDGLNSATAVYRGFYVDHDVTGTVSVRATADVGAPCVRYAATDPAVQIPTAGAIVPVSLRLAATGSCSNSDAGVDGSASDTGPPDGNNDTRGTGGLGAGGSGGAGGRSTGGAGGGGPGGVAGGGGGAVPPSLASCREYLHSVGSDCTIATNNTTIFGVSISPNGQLVVSGGDDGRAKVWRFDGRTLVPEGHILLGSGGYGVSAFSPDGSILAVGWSTGIDLWNVATWTRLRVLTTTFSVYDLAFTPDGQQVFSIDYATLYAHAIGTSAPLHSLAIAENTWAMAVSPAPSTTPAVAVATQMGTVRVFTHSATGFVAASMPLPVSKDASTTQSVRFSPDGRLLVAGSGDGLLHLWNYPITSTMPSVPDIDVDTPALSSDINGAAFSPNGRYIAVAGGLFSSLTTWNAAAPRSLIASFLGPTHYLLSVVFSPSGTAIIAGETACGAVLVCAD